MTNDHDEQKTAQQNAEATAKEPGKDEHDHRKEVQKHSALSVHVVHDAIRNEGEKELQRPNTALAWSGLAAGLSMGFSLIAQAALLTFLPEASWVPLVTKAGYSVGFIIVILGRQQLFTENTLTVVMPLMFRRTLRCLGHLLRVWAIVLIANLVGGCLFALVLAHSDVFDEHFQESFRKIGEKAIEPGFGSILIRGIFAGWLIALLIWLLPAAEANRLWVILILTYLLGIGHLSHVIAGSIEVMYLAWDGHITWLTCLGSYTLPALVGNIIGGVLLTTGLNHAQVVAGQGQEQVVDEQDEQPGN